jgi:hypothetical protein
MRTFHRNGFIFELRLDHEAEYFEVLYYDVFDEAEHEEFLIDYDLPEDTPLDVQVDRVLRDLPFDFVEEYSQCDYCDD